MFRELVHNESVTCKYVVGIDLPPNEIDRHDGSILMSEYIRVKST